MEKPQYILIFNDPHLANW